GRAAADRRAGAGVIVPGGPAKAAGGVLTAKQAPHRPGTAPAPGLRAGRCPAMLSQTNPEGENEPCHSYSEYHTAVMLNDGNWPPVAPPPVPSIAISDGTVAEGN